MAHVFVAPHPDDVALSCGGLIASLRELGQNVTILTVYSGAGAADPLSPYQREALGFGTKTLWPSTEAFNRFDIAPDFTDENPATPAWVATEDRLEATVAGTRWQRATSGEVVAAPRDARTLVAGEVELTACDRCELGGRGVLLAAGDRFDAGAVAPEVHLAGSRW